MSGGKWNYCNDMAREEIFGWSNKPANVFEDREISLLIWDVFQLMHEYDWYASGDTCEETWLKAKRAFKKKWFGKRSKIQREIIDTAMKELKDDLYKTFLEGESDD